MKRQIYHCAVLFVMLHCFGYEWTMQASDKAKEAKTIVVVDLKLLKTFDLLCNFLQKNDETSFNVFQKILDQSSSDILKMKTSNGQTLLDFAIQKNTDFKFIHALINKTIKQMILANDQTCLDELLKHFEIKEIIAFLFRLRDMDSDFSTIFLNKYMRMMGQDSKISNVDTIGMIVFELILLRLDIGKDDELIIQSHFTTLKNLLSSSSMLHDVTLPLILEKKMYFDFQTTVLGSFFRDDEASLTWPVEKIIAILNCYVNAGVDLSKQCARDNNLMFQILLSFRHDFDKCCNLLRYFLVQGLDINEIVANQTDGAQSLLFYAVAVLKCSLPIILFLLENGANVNEQLLRWVQPKQGLHVDKHLASYTPLIFMIREYSVIELAQMFTLINREDLFREPFLMKIQKKSKDKYNHDVTSYEEFPRSSIELVSSDSDYQGKIKLLMKYGADINQTSSDQIFQNLTPLMAAVNTVQNEMVAFLLQQGADIFAPTRDRNAMVILKETKKNFRSDRNKLQQLKEIEKMFEVEIAKKEMLKAAEAVDMLEDEAEAFEEILEVEEQRREHIENQAIHKEKNEKRKAELQAAHQERVKRYNEKKRIEVQKMQERQDRAKSIQQEKKEQQQGESIVALEAMPAISIRDQNPNDLLKHFSFNDLKPEEKNRIINYLQHLTQALHFAVSVPLQVKFGYREDLLGKKKVEIDISHILSVGIDINDNRLNFAGGHMYQTVQNLIQFPIIKSAEQRVDPATQCAVFTLQPVSLNAKSILKTTFPGSWSPEKILEAIVSSEFVGNQTDEEGMEIVYAKTKTSPEIPLKLIFKKAHGSFPTKLVTVIPMPDFRFEMSPQKAGKK